MKALIGIFSGLSLTLLIHWLFGLSWAASLGMAFFANLVSVALMYSEDSRLDL